MTKTLSTLFGGGGLFDIGATAAGLTPLWSIEKEAEIGKYNKLNHPRLNLIIQDVRRIDFKLLDSPYWLHASPPCINASQASQGGEVKEDIELAQAVCRAIVDLMPPVFSLENVWQYRNFESFLIILRCLKDNNYAFSYHKLNSANYGVPQTRERLILIARHNGPQPSKPIATHAEFPQVGQFSMFDFPPLKRWVGWYEAIEDLLDDLEDSEFAAWQLKLLPNELKTFIMSDFDGSTREVDAPTFMVRANQPPITAFLSDCNNTSRKATIRQPDQPAMTVASSWGAKKSKVPTAFVMGAGTFTSPRFQDEPMHTITSSSNQLTSLRALLVNGQNASNGQSAIREEKRPAHTVTGSMPGKGTLRAFAHNRIVKLDMRCLRRFQSIPDSAPMPDRGPVVGNGVSCLLAWAIVRSVLDA